MSSMYSIWLGRFAYRTLVSSFTIVAAAACARSAQLLESLPRARWADLGKSCGANSPTVELPAISRDSLGNPFDKPGQQGQWTQRAELARHIPGGWGGLTRGSRGLGMYLVDTTKKVVALEALAERGFPFAANITEVKAGRWDYIQLYDWFRYIHTHIRGIEVTMWSLDEGRNRILYGVESEASALKLEQKLASLNVPCSLIFIEVTGRFFLSQQSLSSHAV